MTTDRRLASDLPDILGDLAMGPYPDYIDDVLAISATVRQRPAWTFPERWIPMVDIVHRPALVPRLPWRAFSMALLLIALFLAIALALFVGSQTQVPAPFGPARNGLIAYESAGDIYTADPVSGAATAIVSGPETDIAPRFSPHGTHVVFERKLPGGISDVYVARSDGSQLTRVTPTPVVLTDAGSWRNYEFSPDEKSVLIMESTSGAPSISIAQIDGSGIRRLDVGRHARGATFRPPVGAEILFTGGTDLGSIGYGVFAVDPASGVVRTIVEPAQDVDLTGASWSPDGARIAYWTWDTTVDHLTARTHVVGANGTGDRILIAPPGAIWNALAAWSNDGTRLFVIRGYTGGEDDVRPAVLPADGSSVGFEISFGGNAEAGCCAAFAWSPDDSKILGRSASAANQPLQQMILDPVTRQSRAAPWATTSDPTWQRKAP